MRLYFIRHGQSENNALYAANGNDVERVDDPQLTEIGKRQAQATAAYLASSQDPVDEDAGDGTFQLTHLYASLMQRSLATGSVIAQSLRIPWSTWGDWHETGGIYLRDRETDEYIIRPGITRGELASRYPGVAIEDAVSDVGWWNRPYEREEERQLRAQRVLDELLVRHGGTQDRVAVVSHGGFFMHFLAAVLGIEWTELVWFRMYNCAITRFDFMDGERVVVYHDLVTHLSPELIT
jgi:2,3-bisphosphoglycerate-dependent phosphoglycerate mutase